MQNKENTYYQKNFGSAALFALAVLVLVVSCPLKSLLKNNDVAQSSIPFKSKQTGNNQYTRTLLSSQTNGCAVNNKKPVLQAYKNQFKKVDAPVFAINIFNNTGYYIHSSTNRIKVDHNLVAGSGHLALPLFLQHRSLLI